MDSYTTMKMFNVKLLVTVLLLAAFSVLGQGKKISDFPRRTTPLATDLILVADTNGVGANYAVQVPDLVSPTAQSTASQLINAFWGTNLWRVTQTNYGSVNRFAYTNTMFKFGRTNGVHFMTIGTGLTFAGSSVEDGLESGLLQGVFYRARQHQPVAGYYGFFDGEFYYSTSGSVTSQTGKDSTWFGSYLQLAASSATIQSAFSGTTPTSDAFSVFYVQDPSAGTFDFQTNINSGGWATAKSINAVGTRMGVAYEFTNSYAAQTLFRVVATSSGTTSIIGMGYKNTATEIAGGLTYAADLNQSAASYSQVDAVASNIFTNWLLWAKPDMVMMQSVEGNAAASLPYYCSVRNKIKASIPTADIVAAATYPIGGAPDNNDNYNFNLGLSFVCLTNGDAFFDGYTPFGNYPDMIAKGYYSGTTTPHVNNIGYARYNELFCEWLGIFGKENESVVGVKYTQLTNAPSAAEVGGGQYSGYTNYVTKNIAGTLWVFWTDGATVYSKKLAP